MGRIPEQVIKKSADFKLVVTIALKREVPKDFFISHGIPVHTLAALKSGALKQSNPPSGMLVIITGAGLQASEEAALRIRDSLRPLFVVNIGTCGLTSRSLPLSEWLTPQYVANEEGGIVEINTKLPSPFSGKIKDIHSLITVRKASLGNLPETWKAHDAIDMECFPQAKVFHDAQIPFHCLKFGTDYSDHNAVQDFNRHIKLFIENLKKLFRFAVQK